MRDLKLFKWEDIKDFFLFRSTAITSVDERHGLDKPSQTETLGFILYRIWVELSTFVLAVLKNTGMWVFSKHPWFWTQNASAQWQHHRHILPKCHSVYTEAPSCLNTRGIYSGWRRMISLSKRSIIYIYMYIYFYCYLTTSYMYIIYSDCCLFHTPSYSPLILINFSNNSTILHSENNSPFWRMKIFVLVLWPILFKWSLD